MNKSQLFTTLTKEWGKLCPKQEAQKKATAFWNDVKLKFGENDFANEINLKIQSIRKEYTKKQPTIYECIYQAKRKRPPDPVEDVTAEVIAEDVATLPSTSTVHDIKLVCTPAQDKLSQELLVIGTNVEGLEHLKTMGLLTEETSKLLKTNKEKRKKVLSKITRLIKKQKTQQKYRKRVKDNLQKLKDEHPELHEELKLLPGKKPGPGRPPLEDNQPLLLTTILDIVSRSSSADPRRRSENLQSCRTLSDLHKELLKLDFQLTRSATYLRLLPRNRNTLEGRRHVTTVPVKLIRPQNDLHKTHVDGHFAAATINFIKQLAEIMGPKSMFVLSQDDKARIPLGLVAANKQSPILMNMEYRIRLPDHDWVVAPRHKLIPSVYAALNFDDEGKLSYSGPTYIAIRSGRHDKSTAKSHSVDLNRLLNLDIFKNVAKTDTGAIKPNVVLLVDGGPDESPRFPKTIFEAVNNFKKLNLDSLFIGCYAPGQSAFNPAERRMAPLSKDLCGVILPHAHYGSHLNDQGQTVDLDLEKKNFKKAGECLASIWNENIIDGYNVFSEFVDSPSQEKGLFFEKHTEAWLANHIRVSKYLLQIVKCNDILCCTSPQTNIKTLLQNGFIPAPVLFGHSEEGITVQAKESTDGHFYDLSLRLALEPVVPKIPGLVSLPFDMYCPTAENIANNICACGISFPTKVACYSHSKEVHRKIDKVLEKEIEEVNTLTRNSLKMQRESRVMQVIEDVIRWYKPIFEDT